MVAKNPSRDWTVLKNMTMVSKKNPLGQGLLGSFSQGCHLQSFCLLGSGVYEGCVLKTRVPILWMSLEWKGCPQGKLVSSNRVALLFPCWQPLRGIHTCFYAICHFHCFLPTHVCVCFCLSKSLCLFQRGKCHDNRVCGGNTGFWSLQPYWAVIQPTTDLRGNELTICRESVSHCSHLLSSSAHLHSEQWQCLSENL